MEDNNRYSGQLVNDYELLKVGFPKIQEAYEALGAAIKYHTQEIKDSKINALEIGCGSGEATLYALKADSRIKVTAVDKSDVMIERLTKNFSRFITQERLEAKCTDAVEFLAQTPNESIPIVYSSWCFHNFPRVLRNSMLAEVYRVLTPGGIFVNMDKYVPDNAEEFDAAWNEQVRLYNNYVKIGRPDLKDLMLAHEKEDMQPQIIMKESEGLQDLRDLGFKEVKTLMRLIRDATVVGIK